MGDTPLKWHCAIALSWKLGMRGRSPSPTLHHYGIHQKKSSAVLFSTTLE
ncbi:MAG: hypothetical protein F6K30_07600 [Cyanothece sp. SIO2G6]|nr:hypothetical protein [Cyanothece sp. SIO2G6]